MSEEEVNEAAEPAEPTPEQPAEPGPAPTIGNKDTKEVAVALVVVGACVYEVMKDGFQAIEDISALFQKLTEPGPVKDKLDAAIADIGNVSAEIGDLELMEILDIAAAAIAELMAVLMADREPLLLPDDWKAGDALNVAIKKALVKKGVLVSNV